MSIIVRVAKEKDVPRIKQLLHRAKLNQEGLDNAYDLFLVVEEDHLEKIVATTGLEIFGDIGFLRSFVMESESWRSMIGLDLMMIVRQFAKQKGCKELYLLTNPTSKSFFEYLQFTPVVYRDVPKAIKESSHFKQSFKDSVLIMKGI